MFINRSETIEREFRKEDTDLIQAVIVNLGSPEEPADNQILRLDECAVCCRISLLKYITDLIGHAGERKKELDSSMYQICWR